MKWITRERARVDRVACPWLVTRFIDRDPLFLFVPETEVAVVAAREGATAFDVPGAALGHHGRRCSFDAFLDVYGLDDPGLAALALIVRGADTDDRGLTPESAGLFALASGFRETSRDDHENMARQFPAYDALYAYCRSRVSASPTVLFVCLHGAAKSALAAERFRRLARARGLAIRASSAGLEPEPAFSPRVVEGLGAEGIDVRGRRPRHVMPPDIAGASRIVSLGADLSALAPRVPVERWDDVPAVSDGYEAARDAIDARLEELLRDLSPASGPSPRTATA